MEGNTDRGAFVRAKADAIFKLLNEPELLAKERENAAKMMQKQQPQNKLENASQPDSSKEQVNSISQQDTSSSFIFKASNVVHPVTSTPLINRNQKHESRPAINTSSLITIPEGEEIF